MCTAIIVGAGFVALMVVGGALAMIGYLLGLVRPEARRSTEGAQA